MKHQTKSIFFKILSCLPNQLGYSLYYFFQNIKQSEKFEYKLESAENTFSVLIEICKKYNIKIEDSTVLEIGSGWLPSLPYLFLFKKNAKKILTFDINEHYQVKNIKKFNKLFESKNNIKIELDNEFLPKQIKYFPKKDVTTCNDNDVNLIFSRFVLEHVKPNEILQMHKKFKENFKKGTHIIHFISPSDHRAYTDKSISLQDFLQYSQDEWNKTQTKFDYHNRLRFSQYVQIFESIEIEILHQSFDTTKKDSVQYNLFKKLKLNDDFKHLPEEDLLAGNIIIVLKL